MYEHRRQPLLSSRAFLLRVARHGGAAAALLGGSLALGMAGYAATEGMSAIDAFLNASMILGGMGPVSTLRTDAGKLFAGIYALYSGVVFIATAGILLAPVAHRILHRLTAEIPGDRPRSGDRSGREP